MQTNDLGRLLIPVLLSGLAAGWGCSDASGPSDGEDAQPPGAVVLLEDFTARQVFPATNWWNLDVGSAPLDPSSDALIDFIGRADRLHPDFGAVYGLPYVGVSGTQPLVSVHFDPYGDESDAGAPGRPPGYPIPDEARSLPRWIEGGVPGGGDEGDRHLLVIDRDNWVLFETWNTRWNVALGRWEAGSGAIFDLGSNARRPETWTSADAAGLAIFPGLIRYDEVVRDAPIDHAFRVTVHATAGYYVWPASHKAGSTEGAPPMGARLRLKASVDLSGHTPEMRRIFEALKRYGLIVADNGSDMFVQGTMDPRWDDLDGFNDAFRSLTVDDFEVVQLGWRPTSVTTRN